MWTPATREKYSRHTLRYQSDVTDQEWLVIEPLLRLDQPKPKTGEGFEATIDSARAFLYAASIMLLVRRIARDA